MLTFSHGTHSGKARSKARSVFTAPPLQDQLCTPDGPLPDADPAEAAVLGLHQGLPLHREPGLDLLLLSPGAPEANLRRPS